MAQETTLAGDSYTGSGRLSRWGAATWRFTRRRPLGAAGAVIIVVMIAAAALANIISPYEPLATDYAAMLQAPSAAH